MKRFSMYIILTAALLVLVMYSIFFSDLGRTLAQMSLPRPALEFDEADDFSEGLAAVRVGRQYGYIDTTGKAVIAPQFDFAGAYCEGLAPVRIGGTWGYIDRTGKKIFESAYGCNRPIHGGYVPIYDDATGLYGFMDKTGKVAIPPQYREVADEGFADGLAAVAGRHCVWGYIDTAGKLAIPLQFVWAERFCEGLAAVKISRNGGWGFIDKTGKLVIPAIYPKVDSFSEGMAGVWMGGGYGYVDRRGVVVLHLAFGETDEFVPRFSEGLAAFCVKGKWGFMDKNGKVVVSPVYDSAAPFHEGLALVEKGRAVRVELNRERIRQPFESGRGAFARSKRYRGQFGFIDKAGKVVIPIRYDWACSFHDGVTRVYVGSRIERGYMPGSRSGNEKWYYIDTKGHPIGGSR